MSNQTNTNTEAPASFRAFLAKQKGFVSDADAKQYAKFRTDYEWLHAERLKFVDPMARKAIDEVRERAVNEPSPENIAALSALDPAAIRAKFEHTAATMHRAIDKLCTDAMPLAKRILEAAMGVLDNEIQRVEESQRAAYEQFGVPFDPSGDRLLLSLSRWRQMAEHRTRSAALRPDEVEYCVGEVRAKSALFGILG